MRDRFREDLSGNFTAAGPVKSSGGEHELGTLAQYLAIERPATKDRGTSNVLLVGNLDYDAGDSYDPEPQPIAHRAVEVNSGWGFKNLPGLGIKSAPLPRKIDVGAKPVRAPIRHWAAFTYSGPLK